MIETFVCTRAQCKGKLVLNQGINHIKQYLFLKTYFRLGKLVPPQWLG